MFNTINHIIMKMEMKENSRKDGIKEIHYFTKEEVHGQSLELV